MSVLQLGCMQLHAGNNVATSAPHRKSTGMATAQRESAAPKLGGNAKRKLQHLIALPRTHRPVTHQMAFITNKTTAGKGDEGKHEGAH